MTVDDILWAGGTVDAPDEEPKSELVVKVVLPVLSSAEQEYGQALSRISLDDMVRAALNGHGTGHHESGEPRDDFSVARGGDHAPRIKVPEKAIARR
jgi:hypothetical protein